MPKKAAKVTPIRHSRKIHKGESAPRSTKTEAGNEWDTPPMLRARRALKEREQADASAKDVDSLRVDAPLRITEVPPPPPNPLIAELSAQIAQIVGQRAALLEALSQANAQAQYAQANVENASRALRQSEDEVQYRMGLIRQIQGGSADPLYSGAEAVYSVGGNLSAIRQPNWPTPGAMMGSGSIPGTPTPVAPINPGF